MKDLLLVIAALFAIGFGYLWYEHRGEVPAPVVQAPPATPEPTPKGPVHHFTPEGTFFLVDYVAVKTAHGVTGLEPGQMVRFVSADADKGTLVVTEGVNKVEVFPTQITNDIELAALARRQDQDSQRQLAGTIQAASNANAKAVHEMNVQQAKDMSAIRTGSAIGGGNSKLDNPSVAASSFDRAYQRYGYHRSYLYYGSPYYYLNRSSNYYGQGD